MVIIMKKDTARKHKTETKNVKKDKAISSKKPEVESKGNIFRKVLKTFSQKLLTFSIFDMLFFVVSLIIAYSLTKVYELFISRFVNAGTLTLNAPKESILAGSTAIYVLSSVLTLAAYFLFLFLEWKRATGSDTSFKRFFPFSLYGVLTHLYMFFIFFVLFVFIKGLSVLNNTFLLLIGVLMFIFVLLYTSVYYVFSAIRFFEANRSGISSNVFYTLFDTIRFSFKELKKFLLPFAILLISFVGLSFLATIKFIASRNYLLFLFVFVYLAIFKAVYCTVYENSPKDC